MGNHCNTFIVWGGFACGWWDFEREEEIVLLKLEMRCLKSYPNQLFVACNIFGVRYEKKRKENLSPRWAGGKCWIKSATSEKCLDIAITVTSTKSQSCAILETSYIRPSFTFPIILHFPPYFQGWICASLIPWPLHLLSYNCNYVVRKSL